MATRTVGDDSPMAKALRAMYQRLKSARVVQAGFFENATYPDGTPVAMVAAVHNWGAPKRGIPPRPFFSNTVDAKKSTAWRTLVKTALIHSNYDADKTLELVGQVMQADIQTGIKQFVGAPLKPATIKRKGFDKQLIDSGKMLNSVSHQVKK